jgi:hypothetical protein
MMQDNRISAMDPPEYVEGFIDLETLSKIHDALCVSEDDDDISLGAWIKSNYLYEPVLPHEEGRKISSREGFQKLDRAYKRVRLLTNRAQDKWPFFDKAWKKMSATRVRKVALGEISTATLPEEQPSPQTSPSVKRVHRSTIKTSGRDPAAATQKFENNDIHMAAAHNLRHTTEETRTASEGEFVSKTITKMNFLPPWTVIYERKLLTANCRYHTQTRIKDSSNDAASYTSCVAKFGDANMGL